MPRHYDQDPGELEKDPRTLLADKFREFFISAIENQIELDAAVAAGRASPKQPGSWYKTDGPWLKINLEIPAADVVFNGKTLSGKQAVAPGPSLWAMIPLGPVDEGFELQDTVFASEDIMAYAIEPGHKDIGLWVRDNYCDYLPESPETLDTRELTEEEDIEADDQEEPTVDDTVLMQQVLALNWLSQLDRYGLRAIASTKEAVT